MSTAAAVPETWDLDGDDARATLGVIGKRRLLADAFQRLRWADGFSHARSLAFTVVAVSVQGTIGVVGLATALGRGSVSDVIVRAVKGFVPGPAGDVVTSAVDQAGAAGSSHRILPLVLGLLGALVSATTAMGQVERGCNRLYGVEQDRPTVPKYAHAALLAATAGTLATAAFGAVALGRSTLGDDGTVSHVWSVVRWPVGLGLIWAATALLFRWCPRRRQPAWSWLAFGSTVGVGLWFAATAALALFFRVNSGFGATYGPLAGILALLLWAFFTSVAIFYGAAVAAQLEAARAGVAEPQDPDKADGDAEAGAESLVDVH